MIVDRTWWQDGTVHFSTTDGAALHWTPGQTFHWTVGPIVAPVQTPMYVFEPRPVHRITTDMAEATTDAARQQLTAEMQLCDRPHVVYVAFHGILPKVGMTSQARFATRLQEQGADAGFVVATTEERAEARAIEQSVAFRFNLPEWRTHKEILPQWTRPVDRQRIQKRAEDLANRMDGTYHPGELQFFEHPLPVLPSRPQKMHAEGTHAGTVVGAKGNFLVYRSASGAGRLDVGLDRMVAIKRTDLEGRALEPQNQD